MLQAPTGFGKTLTAVHIIRGALDKGKTVIFTVPALSLIDQTVAAFEADGLDCIGVMQGDHPRTDTSQPVQVASVQTLARRRKPAADLVLIDEAHLAFDAVHTWMADPDWARVPFIGLSATPWTRGLGRHYDDLIVAARTGDLIEAGYLSRFVVFAPSVPDLTGVKTVAGDYHEGQLADALNKVELVGDVIVTWQQRAENRPTLVYGVDRAHAQHLMERFLEAGVAAEYIDAFTAREDRERIFRRFRSGDTRVICNVATLAVGMDMDVRCIVDARPTKSEMRFVQTIGRALRTALGKDHLLVLDHAGNHLRLGLVTDIHHDRLDDGEQRRGNGDQERAARLPRRCDECTAIIPVRAERCTHCGTARHAKSAVRTVEGRLVELGSGESSRVELAIADQAAFYSELRGLARERRYADGWPSHKFKEKFGIWPNHPDIRSAPAKSPTLKTKQWVLSRNIARVKGCAGG
jgi:superfamily II DNA or RNA helicase